MDEAVLEKRYLKVTKRHLIWTGIWPNQRKSDQYIFRALVYIIMTVGVFGQIARIVTFFSMTTVLQQLSFLVAAIMLLMKQANYIIYSEKFKAILDGMFHDWKYDKTEEEIAIMVSYMNRGAFFTLIYMGNAYFSTGLFVQLPFWSRIADILAPSNTSRPLTYVYPVHYFVDSDRYDYWILAATTMGTIVVMVGFIGCDTYFIFAVQHACGLFAVARYRFKKSVDAIYDEKTIAESSNETYRRVCHSIKVHDRAMRYVREVDDLHYAYFLVSMGMIVAAFSCTLVWISRLKLSMQLCKFFMFLMVQLMHILFLTLQGQFVINSMDQVYNDIYNGLWYNSLPKTQALFMFALRSSTVPPQITAGGLFPMNLQTFSDILKTSVSYFTVFQSI